MKRCQPVGLMLIGAPLHVRPQGLGGGFVHDLILVCAATPHFLLIGVHWPHALHPPLRTLTEKKNTISASVKTNNDTTTTTVAATATITGIRNNSS